MKIEFLNLDRPDGVDGIKRLEHSQNLKGDFKNAQSRFSSQKSKMGAYRLDIGADKTRSAYSFQGKTSAASDSQNSALKKSLEGIDNYDAAAQHNYMAVMSNTMSQKDFVGRLERCFYLR